MIFMYSSCYMHVTFLKRCLRLIRVIEILSIPLIIDTIVIRRSKRILHGRIIKFQRCPNKSPNVTVRDKQQSCKRCSLIRKMLKREWAIIIIIHLHRARFQQYSNISRLQRASVRKHRRRE